MPTRVENQQGLSRRDILFLSSVVLMFLSGLVALVELVRAVFYQGNDEQSGIILALVFLALAFFVHKLDNRYGNK